ncbi:MAG: TolC family protein [Acidobacteriales bacterium]|nr:TolC family protein [Terriglobales bacterium]
MKLHLYFGLMLWLASGPATSWAQAPGADNPYSAQATLLLSTQGKSEGAALDLDEAERIALEANPDIQVAVRRLSMAKAHLAVAGALDDPMAMYRGWGVPLNRPWDYNAAQNMFSVSQTFSSRTKRDLRTNVARSDLDQAQANLEAARLDVRVRVRKAFFDLLISEEEVRIHEQHVGIAQQAIGAARIKYTTGSVPQQDVLKAQMAMTQLAEHMIRFDRDAEVARARLNTLLGRRPDAPLEVRGEHAVSASLPPLDSLATMATDARPDLAAAKVMAERSHKEQRLAKAVYIPDFTVSAGYMVMPAGQDFRNSYMVEGTMNLPWLNRKKHDAEIAEAAAKATEQDAELAALENTARGQIAEALTEAKSAQKMALLYQDQLKPQAEATLQSSVIAYQNNKTGFLDLLDSQMRVVDLDLAWAQALGDFDARLADLEMAVGAPIETLSQSKPEVK